LKKISLLLIVFSLMSILSGCHGSVVISGFDIPEQFDTSKTYNITFWAKNDTNKNQVDIYQKAIDDFESYYPNIQVNIRLYTDYGKIYNDVITNIATQTTPNVCITYPDHIATYLSGENTVVPLDQLIDDPSYGLAGSELLFESPARDQIVDEYLEECKLSESYYALPFMRSTEVCYINKTFVEKLGYEVPDVLTWDFIWEVSEAAMKKNDDGTFALNGQNTLIPFIYKSTDNMMIQYSYQSGTEISSENGKIGLFNDTTKNFLQTISSHARTESFSTFKISGYPANFLNAGQCIFAVDSTAGSTWMGSHAPLLDISEENLIEFETVVRPVPQIDVDHISMISQGPSICIFNKEDSGDVLASWLFAQYLLTDSVQIAYAETEGYVPVTNTARANQVYTDYLYHRGENNSAYYQVKLDATKLLLEHTADTFTTAVFNGSASLREAAGQLIEDTVKSTRRKQTIDEEFFTNLNSDIISLYRLNPEGENSIDQRSHLGPLPMESKLLLISLGVIWAAILGYVLFVNRKSGRIR